MSNNENALPHPSEEVFLAAQNFDRVIDEFWRWHRLIDALSALASNLLYGDRALHVVETEITNLIQFAADRELQYIEILAGFQAATASQLKAKAQILLAAYDAEVDDQQAALVRSLANDLVRIPLREYREKKAPLLKRAANSGAGQTPRPNSRRGGQKSQVGPRAETTLQPNIEVQATDAKSTKTLNGKLHCNPGKQANLA